MKKFLVVIGIIWATLMIVSLVRAQSNKDQPTIKSTKQNQTKKVIDKKFVALSTALIASSVYDTETTFAALKRCRDCREANPFMRPFVKNGRPATYAVQMALNGGMIYSAYKLKTSNNPKLKKIWWVVPVIGIATHATAGSLNLRFVF